jgi:tetrapyrrole methylase family protein/MazG family protein
MTLTIVGLGPGSVDDLSLKAWRTLEQAEKVFLRTERHPCVPHLPRNTVYRSFDSLYESANSFEAVYETITKTLLKAAQSGDVVYAVPGDPLVGEATTTRILDTAKTQNITVEIINGISFIEPMLSALGVDALEGLQILDGLAIAAMHHPPLNPQTSGVMERRRPWLLISRSYSRSTVSVNRPSSG